ncbi:MAG: hypothetical protein ACO2PN_00440 [Pyrobaculum sp.]|jgi:hypothetical protein
MPATDLTWPSRLKKPLPKPSDAAYVETRLLAALKRPALEFLERDLTCNVTF